MISVCMASYNGQKYIENQLSSILKQLKADDEVIISDDGSSDDTLSIISGFNDPRIKVLSHPRSWLDIKTPIISRVKHSFDSALNIAQGDYIFLSDQDDEWISGRVDSALQYLETGTDLIVSNCVVLDEKENVLFSSYFDLISPSDKISRTIVKSSFHGCCMAFNAKMLKHVLPFPQRDIGHDTWIGMVCCVKGKVKFLDKPYIKYLRHNNTVTQCGFKSNRSLAVKVKYRIDLVLSLLQRVLRK